MGQVQAGLITLLIIIFLFIPSSYLQRVNNENHEIKQSLNLSARVLANCIEKEITNSRDIAMGYGRPKLTAVRVDKERLLPEFYQVLLKNSGSQESFERIRPRMLVKILVCYDVLYVAKYDDKWDIPYYFTFNIGSDIIYLNVRDDTVRYFDSAGIERSDKTIIDYGLTKEMKNDIIISKINSVVAKYTSEKVIRDNGLKIEIFNSSKQDPAYLAHKQDYFNALDGISFFVVYAENTAANVNRTDFQYIDYNVVGYTVN
jgi:hypothetical protein